MLSCFYILCFLLFIVPIFCSSCSLCPTNIPSDTLFITDNYNNFGSSSVFDGSIIVANNSFPYASIIDNILSNYSLCTSCFSDNVISTTDNILYVDRVLNSSNPYLSIIIDTQVYAFNEIYFNLSLSDSTPTIYFINITILSPYITLLYFNQSPSFLFPCNIIWNINAIEGIVINGEFYGTLLSSSVQIDINEIVSFSGTIIAPTIEIVTSNNLFSPCNCLNPTALPIRCNVCPYLLNVPLSSNYVADIIDIYGSNLMFQGALYSFLLNNQGQNIQFTDYQVSSSFYISQINSIYEQYQSCYTVDCTNTIVVSSNNYTIDREFSLEDRYLKVILTSDSNLIDLVLNVTFTSSDIPFQVDIITESPLQTSLSIFFISPLIIPSTVIWNITKYGTDDQVSLHGDFYGILLFNQTTLYAVADFTDTFQGLIITSYILNSQSSITYQSLSNCLNSPSTFIPSTETPSTETPSTLTPSTTSPSTLVPSTIAPFDRCSSCPYLIDVPLSSNIVVDIIFINNGLNITFQGPIYYYGLYSHFPAISNSSVNLVSRTFYLSQSYLLSEQYKNCFKNDSSNTVYVSSTIFNNIITRTLSSSYLKIQASLFPNSTYMHVTLNLSYSDPSSIYYIDFDSSISSSYTVLFTFIKPSILPIVIWNISNVYYNLYIQGDFYGIFSSNMNMVFDQTNSFQGLIITKTLSISRVIPYLSLSNCSVIIPSTTSPSTTSPSTTEPSTTEPSTTDPSTTEPSTTEPSTTLPSTTEPSTTDPSTLTPSTTEPSTLTPSTLIPSTLIPSTLIPICDKCFNCTAAYIVQERVSNSDLIRVNISFEHLKCAGSFMSWICCPNCKSMIYCDGYMEGTKCSQFKNVAFIYDSIKYTQMTFQFNDGKAIANTDCLKKSCCGGRNSNNGCSKNGLNICSVTVSSPSLFLSFSKRVMMFSMIFSLVTITTIIISLYIIRQMKLN